MGKCHFYKPVKNLKYLMKDQKFITASTRDSLVRILSHTGAVYIFSTFSSRSILILFSHTSLYLSSRLFSLCFSARNLRAFVLFPMHAARQATRRF